jgi:response regulator RpfG family c-di-GMP phosphodiesterase
MLEKQIWIIDDNLGILRRLRARLEKRGFKVGAFDSIAKAREAMLSGKISQASVIILDIMFGISDAKEFMQQPKINSGLHVYEEILHMKYWVMLITGGELFENNAEILQKHSTESEKTMLEFKPIPEVDIVSRIEHLFEHGSWPKGLVPSTHE